MQHFPPEAAVALVQRGAALARDRPISCELALLHDELMRDSGRLTDSLAADGSALELAESDEQRCRALMEVAAGYRVTGDIEEALDALARADSLAEAPNLDLERSKIHYLRGSIYFARLWCKLGRRARNRSCFGHLIELKEPPSRSRAKWYL
jgi:tetratricopeptide (TPR) repeat protein